PWTTTTNRLPSSQQQDADLATPPRFSWYFQAALESVHEWLTVESGLTDTRSMRLPDGWVQTATRSPSSWPPEPGHHQVAGGGAGGGGWGGRWRGADRRAGRRSWRGSRGQPGCPPQAAPPMPCQPKPRWPGASARLLAQP